MYYFDHIKKLYNNSLPPQWSSVNQLNDEIIVVTAITPHYDRLVNTHKNEDTDIKFFAFVDINDLNSYVIPPEDPSGHSIEPQEVSKWQSLPIFDKFPKTRVNAKIHKILIHEFFPKVKYTIWIDGNIQVQIRYLRRLIDTMGDNDIMLFKHYSRNCLYSEAHECMVRLLDSKDKIFDQICQYTQEGYPQGNGLAECPVLIRRNNKKTKEFNCLWWDEILRGSSRDQISFPYVQYKTGTKVGYLPGTINNNEFFRKVSHNSNQRIYIDD